jgi:hypothetical protein
MIKLSKLFQLPYLKFVYTKEDQEVSFLVCSWTGNIMDVEKLPDFYKSMKLGILLKALMVAGWREKERIPITND